MIVRSLLVCLVAFALWNLLVTQLPRHSAWEHPLRDGNIILAEEFLYGAPPAREDIVLIGTSLSALLPVDSLAGRRVHRLSFGGLSVLDGLRLLESADYSPALVLVEANFIDKAEDPAFTDHLLQPLPRGLKKYLPALRHRNRPALVLMETLYYLRNGRSVQQPPREDSERPLNETSLNIKRKSYAEVPPPAGWLEDASRTRQRLEKLSTPETRVAVFEMPVHPDLCAAPRAVGLRDILRNQFAAGKFTTLLEPDCTVFRTTDGHHLTGQSATEYVRGLNAWVQTILNK